MNTRLIIPALLGALAISAPAMAAAGYGSDPAPHATAAQAIVSFVDSGRALDRSAWSPPIASIQDQGRTARLPGDYGTRQAAEVAAAERCREFEAMYDKVSPNVRTDADTAKARLLRAQGVALCAAGKDSQGLAKLETALHDLLGTTPAA